MSHHDFRKSHFQQLSELPTPVYQQLWNTVTQHIQNEPENSIGVAGPLRDKPAFLTWVSEYLDGGIGQRFWGPETQGKWTLAGNRDEVVLFLGMLMVNRAKGERRRRSRVKAALGQGGGVEGGKDLGGGMDPFGPAVASQERLHGRTQISGSDKQGLDSAITGNHPSPGAVRAFKTCLGPENVVTFITLPVTVSFRCFFGRFCEAWGIEKAEVVGSSNVEVRVSIADLGEYCVGFGQDRERGWRHIMKLAAGRPGSEIVVTF